MKSFAGLSMCHAVTVTSDNGEKELQIPRKTKFHFTENCHVVSGGGTKRNRVEKVISNVR